MAAVAAGAGEAGRGGSPLRALVVLVLLQGLFVQAFVGLTPRGPSAQHRRVPPRTWAAPADGDEPEGTAAPESAAPEPPAPAPTIPRPLPEPEHVTLWEYFFGKEGEFEEDLRSVGISRQRLLLNTGREYQALAVPTGRSRQAFACFVSDPGTDRVPYST